MYISGITDGDLPRLTNQGGYDAFVAKYNSQGARQWTRQFGSTANEADVRVSADILGNVYVSGTTYGNLQGLRAGFQDAFLSKYDSAGTHQWTKQFGSSASEWGFDLSADGLGNVYVTGRTDELFEGMANLWDTFLIKFDSAGTQQWRRQFGSQDMDTSVGVSADGLGNVYIAGTTFGNLGGQNAGSLDSFVIKYDDAGNLKWTRQIGTVDNDSCFGVSADGLGNVYSVINGNLVGTNAGGSDAYITKFDSDGSLVSVLQMGTSTTDIGRGVSADKLGSVYLTGYTAGDLAGPNAGIFDAFLAKHFDQAVPEPHVGMLALAAAGALSEGRRRRRFSA
ncbi:MAG TPA: SBBP repeat-containing protein [Lacipirellulaceae bacterium]|nr:SBBP repeat-containing protein [Lacipirellulaceae bacterium]